MIILPLFKKTSLSAKISSSVVVLVIEDVDVVFVLEIVVEVVVDVLVVELVFVVVVLLVVVLVVVDFDVVGVVAVAKILPWLECHDFEQNPKTYQSDKRYVFQLSQSKLTTT